MAACQRSIVFRISSAACSGWSQCGKWPHFSNQCSVASGISAAATLHWFEKCGHFPHWDQPLAVEDTSGAPFPFGRDRVAVGEATQQIPQLGWVEDVEADVQAGEA